MPRADAERVAAWDALRAVLARADQEMTRLLDAQREQELGTYHTLAALARAGGRLRMHELAETLVLGRPTVTRMCDRLQHLDFIRRERIEQDGRAVYVVLTKAGREEFRRCQPAYERFVHEVFGQYLTDAEVATVTRVAAKLTSP